MKRFGEANELVGAAIYLASQKASSFVTGSDIRVDGGFLPRQFNYPIKSRKKLI
jgi:NAD(P)-dependent dehydrogenase (short-subunit alcohol dehydrogenase family)